MGHVIRTYGWDALRHGELGQRSSYLQLERGRKDERCRQEEGLSACVRRHALSGAE